MKSLIVIQEGQFSLDEIRALEAMLKRRYARHIGRRKLTVLWNVAARQHTITDRAWSRSSQVTMEVPNGLPVQEREALLAACEREWRELTGQHPDQLSVAAFDQARYAEILKSNLERFSPYGRVVYLAKLFTRALQSKLRHGVILTQFNQ
ncbi:MAG: hypothetical protein MI723_15095 [Caulobacterales bacterium]|nr:hypothetical protein [Caulobacterales bacterium]